MILSRLAALALSFLIIGAPVLATPMLVMVDQKGCVYCARWEKEIAPAYEKTAEGQFAPLRRIDIDDRPEGVSYARPVNFTPTFILVVDGAEIDRIEGYPGEDFFWPLLSRMLDDHTDFDASAVMN
ncbi:thioredoxin fold domain-containing protein [Aestuariicoccus sp. MJ-SS9]|uniref:thioredoxin fold domain-containing protein n=1 Tax=Aestuariicoccus sp. MJ-SS9 TaxID=3079855 RepID=UPI00290BA30C|nr:thioredoxin fold domain-containing protein [Aestuariicoccus sp. MJ-SS9]MDU8911204.1 thioredoxin fold domain-containing protein [Aestuariicoccus sp. MJ-SS9]